MTSRNAMRSRSSYRRVEWRLAAAGVIALALVVATAAHGDSGAASSDPVIAAAGDIACDPSNSHYNGGYGDGSVNCRQMYTSDLLVGAGLAGVLALGDNQMYCGGYQAYLESYDASWGRVKSITHPVPGNHDYLTYGGTDCSSANAGAAGYFRYFGAAAGTQGQGYYSYDIGTWHLVALNSNCSNAGGCGASSPQGLWLKADLAAHPGQCTLAYWHIPLFSSGGRAASNSRPFWDQLYAAGADVVLHGHDHLYERFAPQTPSGALDTARGVREFIVGTGGQNPTSVKTIARNSEVRNDKTAGVLKLTLHADSYDWQFVPEAGKTFTDSGSAACHSATAGTPTATATASTSSTPTASPVITSTPSRTPTPTRTATPPAASTDTPTATSTSGAAPSATPTPGSGARMTFVPVADSYVTSASPTANYGTRTAIRVDASPVLRSYLRFNVQGLSGTVTRATLRVYANSSQRPGYDVRAVADNSWAEASITYANAPPFDSAIAGSSGAATAGSWTEVDVTALVQGDGLVSFALTTSGSTALSLGSRESGSTAPELVIETAP